MADVITRLKLESGEYDAKIARAVQGLKSMESECRSVNGTLAALEKDQKDYVQSLGNMETVSKTVRGKIGELSSAYTELAVQYRHLTDEEKKGDFGQALSQSLDQLKNRIQESKTELADVTRELNGMDSQGEKSGGILDSLSAKFGLSTQQLVTWGGAIAAGKAALELMKGAIESTEATHDTLARTIAATDAVTNQFLRSLATADFSNFISGLDDIIRKATEAYNTLDEFESFAARFNPHQQAMEAKIQTKMQQARAAKSQGDITRANQLIEEARTLTNQLEQSTREYGQKQTAAGYSTIRSLMGGVDISDQQIAWYADPKNWDTAKQKAEEYKRITEEIARLGEKNITSLSYDQQSRRDNRQQQQRLEAQLKRDPSLKRAYTMLNLRDSGDSDQAKALNEALLNIHGNTLADSRIESLRARVDRIDGTLSNTGNTTPRTTTSRVTTRNEVDIPDIKPQTITVTVDSEEALKELQSVEGITIDPKQVEVSATDNASPTIAKVAGETIDAKNVEVTADDNASPIIDKVASETIDPKQVEVSANDAATPELNNIEEFNFKPKTIEVRVDSVAAMKALNQIQGVSLTLPVDFSLETTESMKQLTEQLRYYNDLRQNATNTEDYLTATQGVERTKQQMGVQGDALSMGVSTDMMTTMQDLFKQSMIDTFGAASEGFQTNEKDVEGMKEGGGMEEMKKGMDKLSSVMSGLSSITSGLSAVGIKLDGEFGQFLKGIQGVISIVQGVMTVIQTLDIPAKATNTAATSLNTTAITAMTTAIYANTTSRWLKPFAQGGVVGKAALGLTIPGNSTSGDNLRLPVVGGGMIAVNSGETILNRAEQGNLVAQMEAADRNQGGSAQPYLDGELIYLGLSNYLRRSGMGEIVTSN